LSKKQNKRYMPSLPQAWDQAYNYSRSADFDFSNTAPQGPGPLRQKRHSGATHVLLLRRKSTSRHIHDVLRLRRSQKEMWIESIDGSVQSRRKASKPKLQEAMSEGGVALEVYKGVAPDFHFFNRPWWSLMLQNRSQRHRMSCLQKISPPFSKWCFRSSRPENAAFPVDEFCGIRVDVREYIKNRYSSSNVRLFENDCQSKLWCALFHCADAYKSSTHPATLSPTPITSPFSSENSIRHCQHCHMLAFSPQNRFHIPTMILRQVCCVLRPWFAEPEC